VLHSRKPAADLVGLEELAGCMVVVTVEAVRVVAVKVAVVMVEVVKVAVAMVEVAKVAVAMGEAVRGAVAMVGAAGWEATVAEDWGAMAVGPWVRLGEGVMAGLVALG
jgi:hypothetical protein